MTKKTASKKTESNQAGGEKRKQSGPTPFKQKPPKPAIERRKRPYKGPGSKSTFQAKR